MTAPVAWAMVVVAFRPFHMVDLHPSATMMRTGKKKRHPKNAPPTGAPMDEHQFTLRLVIYRFDHRILGKYAYLVFVVPLAVAYDEASIHFSLCGSMLATCISSEHNRDECQIAVLR